MRAEKSKHFERTNPERLVEPATGFQMRESDPGVLVIPNQGRNQANHESAKEEIKTAPLEFAAMPRNERENENDRDELERIRVFAERTNTDEQAGRAADIAKGLVVGKVKLLRKRLEVSGRDSRHSQCQTKCRCPVPVGR